MLTERKDRVRITNNTAATVPTLLRVVSPKSVTMASFSHLLSSPALCQYLSSFVYLLFFLKEMTQTSITIIFESL